MPNLQSVLSVFRIRSAASLDFLRLEFQRTNKGKFRFGLVRLDRRASTFDAVALLGRFRSGSGLGGESACRPWCRKSGIGSFSSGGEDKNIIPKGGHSPFSECFQLSRVWVVFRRVSIFQFFNWKFVKFIYCQTRAINRPADEFWFYGEQVEDMTETGR